jgi:16S rRNA (guanine(966)-N(2))-methyltransferase RsmD
VIAGKARRLRLRSVPGDTTRPITDRVKEALFNIIGTDIQDACFLDLFAGSGSVGIEALSRGAGHVLFVDLNPEPIKTIRMNLSSTGLEAGAEVRRGDALVLLTTQASRRYEYIYIAPPQYQGLWKDALMRLDANPGWLAEDAWVVVQIHPVEYEELTPDVKLHSLQQFDKRDYGSTLLIFYQPIATGN